MSYQILDRIRITDNRVDTSSISKLMEFNIYVSALLIDPCYGLGGRFDYLVRGIYVLVGTFFIPSFLLLIIGISQKYTKEMHIAFVNHEWFRKCGRCKCCSKADEEDTDTEDIKILMQQRDQEVPML